MTSTKIIYITKKENKFKTVLRIYEYSISLLLLLFYLTKCPPIALQTHLRFYNLNLPFLSTQKFPLPNLDFLRPVNRS